MVVPCDAACALGGAERKRADRRSTGAEAEEADEASESVEADATGACAGSSGVEGRLLRSDRKLDALLRRELRDEREEKGGAGGWRGDSRPGSTGAEATVASDSAGVLEDARFLDAPAAG